MKRIAIISGKGGVGKSAVSVLISKYLQKEGKQVGLLDIDVHGPNIPAMLGLTGKDAKADENNKIIPNIDKSGIQVMSLGFLAEDVNKPIIWRGPLKTNVIRQLLNDTAWNNIDFLIIDSPPGTGDEIITIMQEGRLDGVVIVGTPQKAAEIDVIKAIHMAEQFNVHIYGLVENMSEVICPKCGEHIDIFGKGRIKQLAVDKKLKFLGFIPININIRKALDMGDLDINQIDEETRDTLKTIADTIN